MSASIKNPTSKKFQKTPITTAAPSDPTAALKTAQIKKAKGLVLKMEKENFKHLILWKSSNNWWKMCQHSALVYAYIIAPQVLGKQDAVSIHQDTDHYFYATDGTISIPNIDKLAEQLATHNIKLSKITDDNIRIFNLPKDYHFTEQAINDFRTAEHGRYDKLNIMFRVRDIYPAVRIELSKTIATTYSLVNRLKPQHRDFLANRIYKTLLDAHQAYMDIEHGHITNPKEGLKIVQRHTEQLLDIIHLISEGRMAPTNRIADAAHHAYLLMTETTGIINKIEAEEKATARTNGTSL